MSNTTKSTKSGKSSLRALVVGAAAVPMLMLVWPM